MVQAQEEIPEQIIGIDLGTTNSAVAVFLTASETMRCEIAQNQEGGRTTPSMINYKKQDGCQLVGAPAKSQLVRAPESTFYDAKRMIGNKFSDDQIQKYIKLWPFKIEADEQDRPVFIYQDKKKNKQTMLPEEVSAKVLAKLKAAAQEKLNTEVRKCVVCVPAYFNDFQRRATIDACRLADLECVKILNEPTAAAIAAGLHHGSDENGSEQKIMIFDFGGGTLDVTILKIVEGRFITMATAGDCHLGGEDVDNALVDHLFSKIEETTGENFRGDRKLRAKLKGHATTAKELLSAPSSNIATVFEEHLPNGEEFEYDVSRATFESICEPVFSRVK